jgi:hypothetical protein
VATRAPSGEKLGAWQLRSAPALASRTAVPLPVDETSERASAGTYAIVPFCATAS